MELPEYLKDRDYGSGMVASFTKEKSEVFCAGSDEWVSGLIHTKTFTEMIIKKHPGPVHRQEECYLSTSQASVNDALN
ncbi:hypothetical protein AJ78_06313 [Emergomyces pasteurianus Ep9510]|uniref:Uncharacterized protein n=1 Tax=Emergomyces pasteurianus Ep9510 TaxID=1447872 RepID=A0A1J9PZ73_9EURO|nr:hypothetical protein AJ78_06313 [Emergomyces pasteurianus Ep9510]